MSSAAAKPVSSAPAPAVSAATASKPAASAQAANDAEWQTIVEAAKKEGKVSLAATQDPGKRDAMMAFEKAYPEIRVDYASLSYADYEARARSERPAGANSFDVFTSGVGTAAFAEDVPAGWYDPIRPALYLPEILDDSKWLQGFDGGFLDKGKKFVFGYGFTVQNYTMANRDVVPVEAVDSYQDLLKPQFKGKITILDVKRTSAGTQTLASVRRVLGEDGMKKLLVDQQPVDTTDRRQIAEWLVRGTYPIGIGVTDSFLKPFRDEGLGKNVRPIKEDRVVSAGAGNGVVMLISNRPHPNAGKVFLNWLLSKAGQSEWATKTLENSRRLDIPKGKPEGVPDLAQPDRYVNFSAEEFQGEVQGVADLAKRIMP